MNITRLSRYMDQPYLREGGNNPSAPAQPSLYYKNNLSLRYATRKGVPFERFNSEGKRGTLRDEAAQGKRGAGTIFSTMRRGGGRATTAAAKAAAAAELAEVEAEGTFVGMDPEHLLVGSASTQGGRPATTGLPDPAAVDAARAATLAQRALGHRGRPNAAVVVAAQRVLGAHAHRGGFLLAPSSAPPSPVALGSTGRAMGLPGGDTVPLHTTGGGEGAVTRVGQVAPALVPPALRRALNEQEVRAQRAAKARRRALAQAVRSDTLTAVRHPRGLLGPSSLDDAAAAALAGGGATRDLAASLLSSSASAPDLGGARAAALARRTHGGMRRGYDLLRPDRVGRAATAGVAGGGQAWAGGGSSTQPRSTTAPRVKVPWGLSDGRDEVPAGRVRPGYRPHLPAAEGVLPAGAPAERRDLGSVDGDTLGTVPRKRRVAEWVGKADLALGRTTHGRLFAQPAGPAPSDARRQQLVNTATQGRAYDLVTGRPLTGVRKPTIAEVVQVRQAHPSVTSSQVFTAK